MQEELSKRLENHRIADFIREGHPSDYIALAPIDDRINTLNPLENPNDRDGEEKSRLFREAVWGRIGNFKRV